MKTFTIALGMIFVSILYASPNVRRYTIGHALDIMEDLVEKRWPPHVATWSLSGNFAPIREERSFEVLVPIEGDVPKDIDGVFLRNGPNPQYEPKGGYHWFDGDGMIHAVSFENGTAAYVNRYIRTPRWTFENDHKGRTMYMKLGDMRGAGGLIKILVINSLRRLFGILPRDAPYHDGTANTNLLFWKDRLLALVENALPFRVYVGRDSNGPSVASVGYDSETFDFPIIAHPHVDQRTGELIALGYLLDQDTHDARYAVFDENGRRTTDFELRLEEKGMMHDFAITKRWSIVPEWSLAFKPKEMVQNGDVFSFDHNRNARLHVFPRHAASQEESKVYELDTPAFGFHVMNAFETDGGEIRMFACMTKNFSMSFHTESIVLYKFTIDPNADVVRRDVVYDRHNIEFVRVRDDLFGHVTQYGYGGLQNDGDNLARDGPQFFGWIKIDLSTNDVVGEISFGPNRVSGEFIFVSRTDSNVEDDGFIMGFVYDKNTGSSELVAYDAATFNNTPVVRLLVPQRVPFGFHATWMNARELAAQAGLSVK